jgi:vesicle transport through interaction with t-SNAREs protein 1
MSEVFEGYERQYCEISAALSRKCAAASALDGGAYPSPRQNLSPSAAASFRLLLYPRLIPPFSNVQFVLPEKKKQKLSEIQADVQESESLVKTTELAPSAEIFVETPHLV